MSEQKYTHEGFQQLKDEYERRTKVDRKRILVAIEEARSFGDLSENAEYSAAKDEQARNDHRIQELEYLIEHAIVVEEETDADVVGLGSFVTVERDGTETQYKIVGSNEANPFENKLSDMSPVGRALIGSKVGDTVKVDVPAGTIEFKVVGVSKA